MHLGTAVDSSRSRNCTTSSQDAAPARTAGTGAPSTKRMHTSSSAACTSRPLYPRAPRPAAAGAAETSPSSHSANILPPGHRPRPATRASSRPAAPATTALSLCNSALPRERVTGKARGAPTRRRHEFFDYSRSKCQIFYSQSERTSVATE